MMKGALKSFVFIASIEWTSNALLTSAMSFVAAPDESGSMIDDYRLGGRKKERFKKEREKKDKMKENRIMEQNEKVANRL